LLESTSSMHRANLTIITTIPVLLLAVATVTISVTMSEDAFARERYSGDSTSQAAAVNNECLNPIFDSNNIDNAVGVGNCGGTISQQDESGSAAAPITSQTANPAIELQRATTTAQPPVTGTHTTCTQCIDMLNATQQQAANQILAGDFDFASGVWPPGITNLVELCEAWNKLTEVQRGFAITDISSLLNQIHVDSATSQKITTCMLEVVSVG
jgi:hypothetical protein